MAFRKCDLLRPHVALAVAPEVWKDKVSSILPKIDGSGNTLNLVSFIEEDCEKRSAQQLDPKDVNIEMIIEQGIVIDPSKCRNALQETDPAILEQYRDNLSTEMVNFLEKNVDSLKKLNLGENEN